MGTVSAPSEVSLRLVGEGLEITSAGKKWSSARTASGRTATASTRRACRRRRNPRGLMLKSLRRLLRGQQPLVRLVLAYRALRGSMTRPVAIAAYFGAHPVRKVQLGAGPNLLDGWLNTDINPRHRGVVYLDATKRFPFPDGTIDYIFSEHQIEHLPFEAGRAMLRECFRVLRPGGKVRVATPNLEALVGLFTPNKTPVQERYIRWIIDRNRRGRGMYNECFVLNTTFRAWGHQFLYDHATLQRTLEELGFVDVTAHGHSESGDPVLRGIESHGKAIENEEEMNRFATMVVEARRPG